MKTTIKSSFENFQKQLFFRVFYVINSEKTVAILIIFLHFQLAVKSIKLVLNFWFSCNLLTN